MHPLEAVGVKIRNDFSYYGQDTIDRQPELVELNMLYKCHTVISIYEVLPDIIMQSITRISISSVHVQGFMHEMVCNYVPSRNCR